MGEDALKWINAKLRNIDIFGKVVIPTFNTKVGGIMSLIILMITSYATVIYLKAVLNYTEIKFNKNEKKMTLANNQEFYNFTSDKGIKFAFSWVSRYGIRINETIGTIELTQHYNGD